MESVDCLKIKLCLVYTKGDSQSQQGKKKKREFDEGHGEKDGFFTIVPKGDYVAIINSLTLAT